MANSYFRFKQFLIEQDKTAMKVTTDACLFGALFSSLVQDSDYLTNVMDIGAGTGLLSLMYAQQFPLANIDAVEIEKQAFDQASENIKNSTWADRINIIHTDIINYTPEKKYDVIICNPPFYENDLKSPDAKRNKALHDSHLTLPALFEAVKLLLKDDGILLILLPYQRAAHCKDIAIQSRLFCSEEILARQTPKHNWFRSIMSFSYQHSETNVREIVIKMSDEYSTDFSQLLSPFYLAL